MSAAPRETGFERARSEARRRLRRRRLRRLLLGAGFGLGLAGGMAWLWWSAPGLPEDRRAPVAEVATPGPAPEPGDQDLASAAPPEAVGGGFIDLPGDPLWIQRRLEAGPRSMVERRARPAELDPARGTGAILLGRDLLVRPGERLAVALPSSQEDFAIFQAQRRSLRDGSTGVAGPGSALVPHGPPEPVNVAAARVIQEGQRHSQGADRVTVTELRLVPSDRRAWLYSDAVVRIVNPIALSELLEVEGFAGTMSDTPDGVTLPATLGLEAGTVVALRKRHPVAAPGDDALVQVAIYQGDRFVAALGLRESVSGWGGDIDAGGPRLVEGSDPWLMRDLPGLIGTTGTRPALADGPPPRILDAVYAAGLRMGLSPDFTGQIVTLLAESHRLEAQAGPDDRVTLLFDEAAEQIDHLLFVGLETGTTVVQCHVFRPGPDRNPACYGARPTGARVVEGSTTTSTATADAAVEALVNRIIQLESGGRIDARNPLSTATGPGQFLDSTWLRMMRVYRPDLTARYSRQELLDLRVTDFDLSREMVLNLAREGERYLRARGHDITPGRLYLAHFLGMEGAHIALSAAPDTPLSTLFSPEVITANPHLRGQTAAFVVDWAENLMARNRGGRVAVIREPQGLDRFRTLVAELLEPA